MKKISMITINKIKMCQLRIFEAEDDDYPDGRIIAANANAIDKYMEDYSLEEKRELLNVINWCNDNCAIDLEKLGWEIEVKNNDYV